MSIIFNFLFNLSLISIFFFRAHKDYWNKLNPSTGRPYSAGMSKPDNWGVTKGCDILKQQKDMTTDEQLEKLRIKKEEIKNEDIMIR